MHVMEQEAETMTLEKHVIDTVKEWQTKIGTDDAGVRLYYPKVSMCGYLKLPVEEDRKSTRLNSSHP